MLGSDVGGIVHLIYLALYDKDSGVLRNRSLEQLESGNWRTEYASNFPNLSARSEGVEKYDSRSFCFSAANISSEVTSGV